MKVAAYLKYIARLKGIAEPIIGGRIKQLLARVELPDVGGKPCEELSKGMRQKIQFAASIINEPELLILDEPFSGLDPVSMRLLRNLIVEEHQRGATILFSTHVMPQAEEICDHVVMIHKGRKVLDDPVAAIGGRHEVRAIVVEPFDPQADTSVLSRIAGVESQRTRGGVVELQLKAGADAANVMRDVAGSLRVARIEIKRPRLEDVFVRLVAGDPDDAASLLSELAKPDLREAAE
jgi:ABC-2 type transport system ATP-binding protein